jgi:hypothetical protein
MIMLPGVTNRKTFRKAVGSCAAGPVGVGRGVGVPSGVAVAVNVSVEVTGGGISAVMVGTIVAVRDVPADAVVAVGCPAVTAGRVVAPAVEVVSGEAAVAVGPV